MPSLAGTLTRFRTVLIVLASLAALFAGLWFCLRWPAGVALYPIYAGAVCTLAGIGAAKSAHENHVKAKVEKEGVAQ